MSFSENKAEEMNENSVIKNGTAKLVAGSIHCPYKLGIIGGGPSGCSIVVRAMRIGFAAELCGFCCREPVVDDKGNKVFSDAQFPFQSAGVCLVDSGQKERFGGGTLQDYIINANTWANKFVTNVLSDKLEALPKETAAGTPLEQLSDFETAIALKNYGCKPAPLPTVGAFLRDCGTIVHETLNGKYALSSKCYLETKVIRLQQVFLPVPPHLITNDEKDPQKGNLGCLGWKISLTAVHSNIDLGNGSGNSIDVYAHKVALATGGKQESPKLPNPAHTKKLMTSDFLCTKPGMEELRKRLMKAAPNQTLCKNVPGRVVIIGGSHSAFSAAWLCINKLNEVEVSASTLDSKSMPINGKFPSEQNIVFCPSGICIVHKSSIKVYYPTKADADKDGYVVEDTANGKTLNSSHISKTWIRGQIHPFGGIRGDAKELWRAIRDGREQRVKMIQVRNNVVTVSPAQALNSSVTASIKQQSIIEKLFDEAVVIVWACGYTTNVNFPIQDINGNNIPLRYKGGQVEVDDAARIMSEASCGGSAVSAVRETPKTKNPSVNTHDAVEESKGDNAGVVGTPVRTTTSVVLNAPQLCKSPSLSNLTSLSTAVGPLMSPSSKVSTMPPPVIEGLMGSGLGYGLQAILESGLPDGSGRADGVAVYLKRGGTLILAQVLGNRVYGGPDIKSWEDRLKLIKRMALTNGSTDSAPLSPTLSSSLDSSFPASPKRPSTTMSARNSFSGPLSSPRAQNMSNRANMPTHIGSGKRSPLPGSEKGSTSLLSRSKDNCAKPSAPIPFPVIDGTANNVQKNEVLQSPPRPMTTSTMRESSVDSPVSSGKSGRALSTGSDMIDMVAKDICQSSGNGTKLTDGESLQDNASVMSVPVSVAKDSTVTSSVPTRAKSTPPRSSTLPKSKFTAAVPVQAVPKSSAMLPPRSNSPALVKGGVSSSANPSVCGPSSLPVSKSILARNGASILGSSRPTIPSAETRAKSGDKGLNGSPRVNSVSGSSTSTGSSQSTPRNGIVSKPPTDGVVLRSNSLRNGSMSLTATNAAPVLQKPSNQTKVATVLSSKQQDVKDRSVSITGNISNKIGLK